MHKLIRCYNAARVILSSGGFDNRETSVLIEIWITWTFLFSCGVTLRALVFTSSSLLCSKYYPAIRFFEAIIDLRLSIHLHARWSHKLKTLHIMSIPNKIKSTQPVFHRSSVVYYKSRHQFQRCSQNVIALHAGKVLYILCAGRQTAWSKRKLLSLRPALAFQPLTLATLGKWATTHDRVSFMGKNCSWTLLPGSTWLRTPTSSKLQNTFCFFKTCWWLTGL